MNKKNLTKKDISNKIFKKIGFSKNFSSSFIDKFFTIVSDELKKNNEVKIKSFGTFKILDKKERVGRNPKTKIEAKITARKVVIFKSSLQVKNKLNSK
jgi:integration host factor subunit alpha